MGPKILLWLLRPLQYSSPARPIFVDQFDNARAVSRLRAGVGFEESLSKVGLGKQASDGFPLVEQAV